MAASKKQIQEWLEELADVESRIDKNLTKFSKETAPARAAYDDATAGAAAKLANANAPLEARRGEIRRQIETAVLEKRDGSGDPAFRKIEAAGYVAEATVSEKREVGSEAFFKAYGKKTGFWDVITVAIGKAEKLIGKVELDAIASKVRSWKVEIRRAG